MVLRKEEAPESSAGLVPAPLSKANPPYPTSPLDEHPPPVLAPAAESPYGPNPNKAPAFNIKTPGETGKAQDTRNDSDSEYSDDEWNRSDDEDFEEVSAKDVPDALKPAGGKAPVTNNALPDALRAGPPAGVPIKRSLENISPMPTGASSASYGAMSTVSEQSNGSLPLQTNNPYLKVQQTGQSNWGDESSEQIWGDSRAQGGRHEEPVELPAYQTPTTATHGMSNLQLNDDVPPVPRPKSPEGPPIIAINSPTPLTTPQSSHPTRSDSIPSNPWEPSTVNSSTDGNYSTEPLSMGHAHSKQNRSQGGQPQETHQPWEGQQNWGHTEQEYRNQAPSVAQESTPRMEQESQQEAHPGWPEQTSSTNPFIPAPPTNQPPPPPIGMTEEEQPPALPPRRSQEENAPAYPPRPIDTGIGSTSTPGPESPNTRMNRQRKEHYQIKHIRWHDVTKPGIRTSPILTQNLNGPCPLLALVNALVLSTPSGIETALVETLRTREQVSLGLLLDAVFDELMSGRRGTAAQELPDVSDLYKFLLALHTGLNVNPMFVPDTDANGRTATLTSHAGGRAGGFENTPDMKLYRTFNIPLLHGWLPEGDSDAFAAFNRVARSYETSQYVQFQEEELEAKLQSGEPLNSDEQQMFTDIHSIKNFLNRWPTQLTDHGLSVMRDSIQPGQVAILFRNDHFSTLFKDPRTLKLVTLVTDQGYSSHDEIVWESLVDVNGQGSELFSGDFRPVGNTSMPSQQHTQQEGSLIDTGDNQGWTTVSSRRGNQHSSATQSPPQASEPMTPHELSRAEQEDHDLALALQLQEEEEDRERREALQRERDNQASVSAIAAQSQARPNNRRTSRGEVPPVIPPRRNNVTTHRPTTEAAPPPTYEEASGRPQYHPPQGHPANPQAPLLPQGSAYQANGTNMPPRRPAGRPMPSPSMVGRPGRRQSAGQAGPNGEERERCIVM